jgi:hypothetical protein
MATVLGSDQAAMMEVQERVEAGINFKHDAPSTAAVATVGTTLGNELLAAE